MITVAQSAESAAHIPEKVTHSIMLRVPDVDRHYQHVQSSGVQVLKSPETHLFGERQYTVVDPGYNIWTFT